MKTRLYTRKRALISSVAMLLVAMIALGTATFAWFSTNTKATASGLTAKTTQSSNIVLSESGNSGWTDDLEFAAPTATRTDSLTPVTTADFTDWYTTTADGIDSGIKGTTKTYSTPTAGTDYLQTKLYVKYDAPSTASKNVDISVVVTDKSNPAGSTENFLRVALVPITDSYATAKLSTTDLVYGNAKDDFAKNKDKFTALDATNTDGEYSLVTNTAKKLISNKSLTGSTVYGFNVFVWYEGTDPHCIDSNSANDFAVSFEVSQAAG